MIKSLLSFKAKKYFCYFKSNSTTQISHLFTFLVFMMYQPLADSHSFNANLVLDSKSYFSTFAVTILGNISIHIVI